MPCKAPLKIGLIMTNEKARSLELFYRPTCPFCQKVLRWMENHNVDNVTLFDITSDSAAEQRLAEVGGKKQVPCLFIDGTAMYESDDIIEYLGTLLDHKTDDIAK